MRILHLIPQLSGGGAERQLSLLAPEMAQAGHEVDIAYLREGPETVTIPGAVLHRIKTFGNYDPMMLFCLHRLLQRIRPDIIQSWIGMMDIIGGVLSHWEDIIWVIREPSTAAGYPVSSLKTNLRTRLARRAAAVVSNSPGGKFYWLGQGIPEKHLFVIENAIPVDRIDDVSPFQVANDTQKRLIYAGRLISYKNVDLLIKAFSEVRISENACLLIAGDGPARPDLTKLVERLKLSSAVRFLGLLKTDDLWAHMKTADVFISLSEFEGMPNCVAEAVACGLPVILSDIPSHRAFLDDELALLVSRDSVTEIAESICHTLEHKEEAAQRAAKALAAIKRRTPALVACGYIKLYENLCKDKN